VLFYLQDGIAWSSLKEEASSSITFDSARNTAAGK